MEQCFGRHPLEGVDTGFPSRRVSDLGHVSQTRHTSAAVKDGQAAENVTKQTCLRAGGICTGIAGAQREIHKPTVKLAKLMLGGNNRWTHSEFSGLTTRAKTSLNTRCWRPWWQWRSAPLSSA